MLKELKTGRKIFSTEIEVNDIKSQEQEKSRFIPFKNERDGIGRLINQVSFQKEIEFQLYFNSKYELQQKKLF